MLAEITQVLLHFGGASSAVDANDIWLHGNKCGIGSTNFCADQHAACGFHGDLHLNGKITTTFLHCNATRLHCSLDLEQVHACFNEE